MIKLIENMVYNNFIFRSIISFLFICIYITLIKINTNYIFYLVILIYLLILSEVIFFFHKYKILIFLYLIISIIFYFISKINNDNLIYFHLMIIIIISLDIFSYLFGKVIGKRKMLLKISPNKTLEGFAGGIIMSYLCGILFCNYLLININIKIFIFISVIIVTGILGDIIESLFKRINGLKNSSNFLPGHGGFFDRFDSFVLAVIPYSIMIRLFQ